MVVVAVGHAVSTDVQLARHAGRHRPPGAVEYVQGGVSDRGTDGHPVPGRSRLADDQTVVSVGP